MDRKTKIETMLMFVNNGIYHVNGLTIFANDFEIVNDMLLKFYSTLNVCNSKIRYPIALIPLSDIYSIDDIKI